MEQLQVLVATMNQKDLSIAETMNIQCGAVIANQAGSESVITQNTTYGTLKMITTATKGVGLNRNIALLAADAELLLFADDDVVYYDGMAEAVVAAFRENEDADVLIFSIDITKGGEIIERRHSKKERLHLWNAMRYGTVTVAVRREAILRSNITFHQYFGGGCVYSYGEDSLFIKACFDHKLHVYSHDYVLGTCCKDGSSCFTGYHEKYFYDKGAMVGYLFPRIAHLMALYFAVSFKRQTDVPIPRRVQLMYKGIRGGKRLQPYQEGI